MRRSRTALLFLATAALATACVTSPETSRIETVAGGSATEGGVAPTQVIGGESEASFGLPSYDVGSPFDRGVPLPRTVRRLPDCPPL